MIYGFFIGAVYFLFYPLAYLLINGKLKIPWWYKSIGLQDIDANSFSKEISVLFLFLLGVFVLIILELIIPGERRRNKNKLILEKEKKIYLCAILVYLLCSLGILISSGALTYGHWYESRAALRESSLVAIIVSYVIWGARILVVAYTFELLERKQIKPLIAFVIAAMICLFDLRFVGNRITVLMFGISLVLYVFINYGVVRLALLAIIAAPLGLMLAVYQNVRNLLFSSSSFVVFETLIAQLKSTTFFNNLLNMVEYGDTVVLLNLFRDVDKTIDPAFGSTFIRFFSWVIPRSIWPDKPLTLSLQLGNIYLPGVAPALLEFGEFYYNFSKVGIILFPLLMYFFFTLLRKFSSKIGYKKYLFFIIGFLIFRMTLADTFIYVVFSSLIYWSFSFLFQKKHTVSAFGRIHSIQQQGGKTS
jgi:hypothetical protein